MSEIKVYGTFKNATESGKIAYSSQIYDESAGRYQDEINREIKSPIPPKLRIAIWNVGNFSLGTSGDPTITPETLDAMSAKWHWALNGLGADILCCCEYNTEFMEAQGGHDSVNARTEIFSPEIFNYAEIGPEVVGNKYMQTAIFTNTPMANRLIVTYPQTTQTGRYYEVVDVMIAGKLVKVVSTHLDFNQGNTDEQREQSHQNRLSQMSKLITDFADYPYVIICGDFNVWMQDITDYDLFKNAGYGMLNHGYIGDILTYPAGETQQSPTDNIVYKGFVSHKIDTINDATLTDHLGIFADFTMIL